MLLAGAALQVDGDCGADSLVPPVVAVGNDDAITLIKLGGKLSKEGPTGEFELTIQHKPDELNAPGPFVKSKIETRSACSVYIKRLLSVGVAALALRVCGSSPARGCTHLE